MTSASHPDLWALALEQPSIDPTELAEALEQEVTRQPLDFRTRLLIRDSLQALRGIWGDQRLARWLSNSPHHEILEEISTASLGNPGFPSLTHRIMEPTRTDTVLQFLRELGQSLATPASVAIGGSVALILAGVLSRRTEDIDIVDEIPVQIRSEHALLESLAHRYSLKLAHFQSHYLPAGWESRLRSLDTYGKLTVQLVDPVDIFLSKLFSNRDKDRDDLRILAACIDRPALIRRLLQTTAALGRELTLRQYAEKNWFVLYGESLPG